MENKTISKYGIFFSLLFCISTSSIAQSRGWSDWKYVGNGIEYSTKWSDKGDCDSYNYIRIRNSGRTEWDYVVVEYTRVCSGKAISKGSITANHIKPGEVVERTGDWFTGNALRDVKIKIAENY